MSQIDENKSDHLLSPESSPVISRLQKTMLSVDTLVADIFRDRFGIEGIEFSNIEQVFDPYVSGIPSIRETQDFLVKNGMSLSMSENLKSKYLDGLKNKHHTCTLMDLFCDAEA